MKSTKVIGISLALLGLIVAVLGVVVDFAVLGVVAGVLAVVVALVMTGTEADHNSDSEGLQLRIEELEAALVAEQARPINHHPLDEVPAERAREEPQWTVPPGDDRLSDPETSLFSEAYFRVALDSRIASARRHLRPVAVAMLEIAQGLASEDSAPAVPSKVSGAIRQTLRDSDTACRMKDGCYALILEDTPENGAVWTVERIRRNLTSRYGHHTVWAGVACYPAHAFSTDEILDQAEVALDAAREWKQDRIEVATAD